MSLPVWVGFMCGAVCECWPEKGQLSEQAVIEESASPAGFVSSIKGHTAVGELLLKQFLFVPMKCDETGEQDK